jgi:hypothetical protein
MPVARFQMPDGRVARFEVPDGTSPEQAQALISQSLSQPAAPQTSGLGALDAANAGATGFNRGVLRLAGLPVDTAANVIDLTKAGLGSAYQAITGKPAPQALQLTDRKSVPLSGDWLVDKARSNAGAFYNPINPEYEGGGWQTAGGGLTAVVNPQSRAQAINQAVLGVSSALAGKTAMDMTGDPALAVAASLAPAGTQQAAVQATKAVVRGANPFSSKSMNEKGQAMGQRIQDLRNAGIDNPTLGLASGNTMIGGLENLLQNTPGAVGVMGRARNAAIEGLQRKTDGAADAASPNRGTFEAGRAIEKGINDSFKGDFKKTQGLLYDRLENEVGSQFPTPVTNTRTTLGLVNADIPGAPALSQFFKNSKIQALEDALRSDTAGSPTSVQVYAQPPRAGGGIMNAPIPQNPLQVVIPQGPQRNTLPFEAVKKTRTMVGNEIADSTIVSDVPRSKWNPLYGALSEDMQSAANLAGGSAPQAFNRANSYSRAGMDRLDRIAPFAEKNAPEQAFLSLERAARDSVSTLQAVKKSLPEGARGQVAGTVIERLGKATNSQQNDTGSVWSPETFLTNWNRLSPKARDELFSGFPNAPQVKADVDAVAKAASMMRDSSKMWANPSGTGANAFARGTFGGIGLTGAGALAGLVNPLVPLGAAAVPMGAGLLARGLTSKGVVDAMARPSYVSPGLLGAQAIPMFSTGLLSQD